MRARPVIGSTLGIVFALAGASLTGSACKGAQRGLDATDAMTEATADATAPPADGDNADAGQDATACTPRLPQPPDGSPIAPGAMYPAPVFLALEAQRARVRTACVDLSLAGAPAVAARLPALVLDAGLALVDSGCTCDYAIRFDAAEPVLRSDAAASWALGAAHGERYAVSVQVVDGQAQAGIHAHGARAVLFALRAALTMASGDPDAPGARVVPAATLVDFPEIDVRGVVDGVYAPNDICDPASMYHLPLSPGERQSLLGLMGRVRENTYVYAPKCDPYTRKTWRMAYPPGGPEEQVLKAAMHDAEGELLDFVWSISPGEDFNFSDMAGELARLTARFDQVRALGVTRFGLFLDDIPKSDAASQAALINLADDYLQSKIPGHRLLVVGTTYCGRGDTGSSCGGPNAYTDTLGRTLHAGIDVMWTGEAVEPGTMSAADMKGINGSLGRKVTIWDNWPASLPSDLPGRSADLGAAISGYFTNPVLLEEPVPAYPVKRLYEAIGPTADYLWAPARYAAAVSASMLAWNAKLVLPPCTRCEAKAAGWSCDPGAATQIDFCDPATLCQSVHVCGGTCAGDVGKAACP